MYIIDMIAGIDKSILRTPHGLRRTNGSSVVLPPVFVMMTTLTASPGRASQSGQVVAPEGASQ